MMSVFSNLSLMIYSIFLFSILIIILSIYCYRKHKYRRLYLQSALHWPSAAFLRKKNAGCMPTGVYA